MAARTFKDKSFDERFKTMGDTAEGKYREWAAAHGVAVERFGFDRPKFKRFWSLPSILRHAPDFACQDGQREWFTEVKGVGRDGVVKIKTDEVDALCFWHELLMEVEVWCWDSSKRRASVPMGYERLFEIVRDCAVDVFDNDPKKTFYKIDVSDFEWSLN